MTVKRRPHHALEAIKVKFANVDGLEITTSALRDAAALGYDLAAIVSVVQQLEPSDSSSPKPRTIRPTIAYGMTAIARLSMDLNSISNSRARH